MSNRPACRISRRTAAGRAGSDAYGVDAFNAIVNLPQAGILAIGRIADRVVTLNGQPAVQQTMVLTLSCDHGALDGARGAQFLGALAELIEEPLALLV